MTMRTNQNKDLPIVFIPEPELAFAHGQFAIDPRDGLTLFGPHTLKSVPAGRIGLIGSAQGNARSLQWLSAIQKPVYSLDKDVARPFFPGFESAFSLKLNLEHIVSLNIDEKKLTQYLHYEDSHQRIHNLANLFADLLVKYKDEEEVPVTVWLVTIPDDIYTYGRPKSKIPKAPENIKTGIKDKYSRTAAMLFEDQNELQEAYKYELDFHNQLKAKLLKHRIVTQVVRESTIAFRDFKNKYGQPIRDLVKFESAIAWNIGTTLYYKMGGTPWKLARVRERVCYIGLVYKRLETSVDKRIACCAAQMFLDSGDGLVFRATTGRWYNDETNEYHLNEQAAFDLLDKAITTYCEKNNQQPPAQIFIHAKTFFNDEEWGGFMRAAGGRTSLVGVRIRTDSHFKLYRQFKYPAPRGLVFIEDARRAFLWSKGFIPKIETVVGLETPNPLSVDIVKGEENIQVVCRDVLMLTKLNYNSCMYGDGLPVTLRFADSIGEIMTAGPVNEISVLPFKHYI
jgi:hypothetical protein